MGEFWAAWERLSASPQDLAARQEVLSNGERLATSLRGASQQVHALNQLVTGRGNDVVTRSNTYS